MRESEILSWRGIAFEEVCLQHIEQIKQALGIAGISSAESSFVLRGSDDQEGIQIDLIIDRADDVVNVCEMKFCQSEYVVTKSYADKINKRMLALENVFVGKTLRPTLITSAPARHNEYADVFVSMICLDDLFG